MKRLRFATAVAAWLASPVLAGGISHRAFIDITQDDVRQGWVFAYATAESAKPPDGITEHTISIDGLLAKGLTVGSYIEEEEDSEDPLYRTHFTFRIHLGAATPPGRYAWPIAMDSGASVARLESIRGSVLVGSGRTIVSADRPMPLDAEARVITTANGCARVVYNSGCRVELRPSQRYILDPATACTQRAQIPSDYDAATPGG